MKSSIYKIIAIIKDEQFECRKHTAEYNVLQNVLDAINENHPEDFAQYEDDNYDGPVDSEAWSGGFADNH